MKRHAFLSMMVVLGLGLLLGFLVVGSPPSPVSLAAPAATPRHVIPGGLSTGNCDDANWANACELQYALGVAVAGDEIWVAAGTYTPTQESSPPDPRSATFQLVSGVAIYGGFAGTETSFGERDWETHVTVLSGDIDGNDTTDPDGVVTTTAHISGTNSYHVVTGSGVTGTAVLDGFTITGGNADGVTENEGGGMVNAGGSPMLRNLTFSGNQAWWGGGLRNGDGSSPTLKDVTFSGNTARAGGGMHNEVDSSPVLSGTLFQDNSAWWGGGMHNGNGSNPRLTDVTFIRNAAVGGDGGGMHNDPGSSPVLTNVTFLTNTASVDGGGMANRNNSNATLTDVTFSANTAANRGGGMYNWLSSPTLTDVTFSDNTATGDGGGMHNDSASGPTLTGVTFISNTASVDGGGMANAGNSDPALTNVTFLGNDAASGGGMYNDTSSPTLTNCILWDNTAADGPQIRNGGGISPTIGYSDIEGSGGSDAWDDSLGTDDGGNIDADPLFVDAAAGDLRLQLTSPAIDAGDNDAPGLSGILTDLGGHPRFADVATVADTGHGLQPIVDMGAYEAPPSPIQVDQAASSDNNGGSWANALTDLQHALTWAVDGVEVWVAEGTYRPGTDREDSFHLVSGVAVYGGFAGTEDSRGERNADPATNNTILSGDIGAWGIADNSYHVVTGSGVTETAVLDGFTITGGWADADPWNGGGMVNVGGGPTLRNLTFNDNNAAGDGGAMYNSASSPTLTNCEFTNNEAFSGGGGGMYNTSGSSPTLTQVAFISNRADGDGGGMYNTSGSSPTLTHVVFSRNGAGGDGGGMYNTSGSSPTLTHVAFSLNGAGGDGGGMYNNSSSPTLTNVTFSDNHGWGGGGMYNTSGSSPTLTDVAFISNTAERGGGGMVNGQSSNPKLTDVEFSGNHGRSGGGMYNHSASSPVLINVIFRGNWGRPYGGGMHNYGSSPVLTNVAFHGNTADWGGGMNNHEGSSPVLTNVTFHGNTADWGGGMNNENWTTTGRPTLTNCILWGNTAEVGRNEICNEGSWPLIAYSDIEGSGGSGTWDNSFGENGGGNIDADPLFVDAAAGDLRLQLASPAIDAGDNDALPPEVTTDLAGNPRIGGLVVDMGAYEAGLDLSIVKSVEPALAGAGQAVTYTLVFSNVAGSVATGLVLSDVVPPSVDPTGFQNLSGLALTATGDVSYTWQVEPLSPGEGGAIAVSGVISPGASGVFSLTNRATITATEVDEHLANNTAAVSSTVDAEPPFIVAVSPPDEAQGVAVTATVAISFSEAIEPGSLAFSMSPDPGGWWPSWNGPGTAVTLGHDPFARGTTYTVTVHAAADVPGNPLAGAPYAWRFTTGGFRVYLPLVMRPAP